MKRSKWLYCYCSKYTKHTAEERKMLIYTFYIQWRKNDTVNYTCTRNLVIKTRCWKQKCAVHVFSLQLPVNYLSIFSFQKCQNKKMSKKKEKREKLYLYLFPVESTISANFQKSVRKFEMIVKWIYITIKEAWYKVRIAERNMAWK